MTNKDIKKPIYIKVKSDGKIYKADQGNLELKECDKVLFESDLGQETGIVSSSVCGDDTLNKDESLVVTIIRKLGPKDYEKLDDLAKEAKEDLEKCREKINAHNLDMTLLDAELSYDSKKLTFYFSAPGRVDFRALVPDLASTFKKMIRLQQVSTRDKAKCIGGYGRCGRKICCKNFLKSDLDSVSNDMAFEQGLLQMGTNRAVGACGKLICCLKFEQETYKEAKKKMPKIGSEIKTPDGMGKVIDLCVVKNKVKVELSNKKIVEVDC